MNILQIELLSNDLAATEHFYAQKMGLPVAFQNTDTITFVAGSSLLTFNRTDTTAYPRYHFAFNIPHNRLDEATAWVESFAEPLDVPDGGIIALTRRALFCEIPGVPPGPHAFFGQDRRGVINPEGSVIDIDAPTDLLVADAILLGTGAAHAHR